MTLNSITPPFAFFVEADGSPLDSGYVYIGNPNLNAEASPKTVYWDKAKTITASQPIRTVGGSPVYLGSPGKLYADGDYSIVVKDRRQQLVYSALTSTIPPSADAVSISFDTLADLNAATIDDGVGYVMAAGLLFVLDPSGTAQTSNGGAKSWSPPLWDSTPLHWGAAGNGVSDDTAALNAWATWTTSQGYDPVGFVEQPVVLDLKGGIYGVSSTVTIPSSPWTSILKDGAFVVVSAGGFDNGTYDSYAGNFEDGYTGWLDFVLVLEASYMNVQNVSVFCQDAANGILMNSGRQRMRGCLVRRMVDVGIWQPNDTGGDKRIESTIVQQQNLTASGESPTDPSSFTAVGVLAEQSDCKITNSTLSWCRKNWVGTGGVQNMYGCHLFSGIEGSPTSTAIIMEWNPPSLSGSLSVSDTYLDNGYVDLYSDKADFDNCKLLLDAADVTQTSLFRVYCHQSAQDGIIPRVKIANATFYEYDGAPKVIEFLDEDFTWDTSVSVIESFMNEIVSSGNTIIQTAQLLRQQRNAVESRTDWVQQFQSTSDRAMTQYSDTATTGNGVSFGSVGDTAWVRTPDGPLAIGLSVVAPGLLVSEGVLTYIAYPEEPTAADFSHAMSDGTASTNGFGTAGAGVYQKLSGAWSKI